MAGLDAGLDPAIPLIKARPCLINRDRRVKPGDDGGWYFHRVSDFHFGSESCDKIIMAAGFSGPPRKNFLPCEARIIEAKHPRLR
jgi:hypothetical protein